MKNNKNVDFSQENNYITLSLKIILWIRVSKAHFKLYDNYSENAFSMAIRLRFYIHPPSNLMT